jgi:cell division protein FtsB
VDLAAIVAAQQDQIDELMAVIEEHEHQIADLRQQIAERG